LRKEKLGEFRRYKEETGFGCSKVRPQYNGSE